MINDLPSSEKNRDETTEQGTNNDLSENRIFAFNSQIQQSMNILNEILDIQDESLENGLFNLPKMLEDKLNSITFEPIKLIGKRIYNSRMKLNELIMKNINLNDKSNTNIETSDKIETKNHYNSNIDTKNHNQFSFYDIPITDIAPSKNNTLNQEIKIFVNDEYSTKSNNSILLDQSIDCNKPKDDNDYIQSNNEKYKNKKEDDNTPNTYINNNKSNSNSNNNDTAERNTNNTNYNNDNSTNEDDNDNENQNINNNLIDNVLYYDTYEVQPRQRSSSDYDRKIRTDKTDFGSISSSGSSSGNINIINQQGSATQFLKVTPLTKAKQPNLFRIRERSLSTAASSNIPLFEISSSATPKTPKQKTIFINDEEKVKMISDSYLHPLPNYSSICSSIEKIDKTLSDYYKKKFDKFANTETRLKNITSCIQSFIRMNNKIEQNLKQIVSETQSESEKEEATSTSENEFASIKKRIQSLLLIKEEQNKKIRMQAKEISNLKTQVESLRVFIKNNQKQIAKFKQQIFESLSSSESSENSDQSGKELGINFHFKQRSKSIDFFNSFLLDDESDSELTNYRNQIRMTHDDANMHELIKQIDQLLCTIDNEVYEENEKVELRLEKLRERISKLYRIDEDQITKNWTLICAEGAEIENPEIRSYFFEKQYSENQAKLLSLEKQRTKLFELFFSFSDNKNKKDAKNGQDDADDYDYDDDEDDLIANAISESILDDLNEKNQNIAKLSQIIIDLKKEIDLKNKNYESLNNQMDKQIQENKELIKKYEEISNKFGETESQLNDKMKENRTLKRKNDSNERKIERLEKKIEEFNEQNKKNGSITEIKNISNSLVGELSSLKLLADQQEQAINELYKIKEHLEDELEATKEALKDSMIDIQEKTDSLKSFEKELQEERENLNTKNIETNEIKSLLEYQINENEKLNKTIKLLTNSPLEENVLDENESNKLNLDGDDQNISLINSLRKQIASLTEENGRKESQIKDLNKQVLSSKPKLFSLKRKSLSQRNIINQLTEKTEEIKNSIEAQHQEKIEKLNERIAELESQLHIAPITDLERPPIDSEASTIVSDRQRIQTDMQNELSRLSSENVELHKLISEMRAQIQLSNSNDQMNQSSSSDKASESKQIFENSSSQSLQIESKADLEKQSSSSEQMIVDSNSSFASFEEKINNERSENQNSILIDEYNSSTENNETENNNVITDKQIDTDTHQNDNNTVNINAENYININSNNINNTNSTISLSDSQSERSTDKINNSMQKENEKHNQEESEKQNQEENEKHNQEESEKQNQEENEKQNQETISKAEESHLNEQNLDMSSRNISLQASTCDSSNNEELSKMVDQLQERVVDLEEKEQRKFLYESFLSTILDEDVSSITEEQLICHIEAFQINQTLSKRPFKIDNHKNFESAIGLSQSQLVWTSGDFTESSESLMKENSEAFDSVSSTNEETTPSNENKSANNENDTQIAAGNHNSTRNVISFRNFVANRATNQSNETNNSNNNNVDKKVATNENKENSSDTNNSAPLNEDISNSILVNTSNSNNAASNVLSNNDDSLKEQEIVILNKQNEERLNQCRKEIDELTTENIGLKEANDSLSSQLNGIKEELQMQQAQIQSIFRLSGIQSESESRSVLLSDDEVSQIVEKLKNDKESLACSSQSDSSARENERIIEELHSKVEELQEENNKKKQEILDHLSTISQLQEQNSLSQEQFQVSLNSQLETLNLQLKQKDDSLLESSSENQRLSLENDQLKMQCKRLEATKEELTRQIENSKDNEAKGRQNEAKESNKAQNETKENQTETNESNAVQNETKEKSNEASEAIKAQRGTNKSDEARNESGKEQAEGNESKEAPSAATTLRDMFTQICIDSESGGSPQEQEIDAKSEADHARDLESENSRLSSENRELQRIIRDLKDQIQKVSATDGDGGLGAPPHPTRQRSVELAEQRGIVNSEEAATDSTSVSNDRSRTAASEANSNSDASKNSAATNEATRSSTAGNSISSRSVSAIDKTATNDGSNKNSSTATDKVNHSISSASADVVVANDDSSRNSAATNEGNSNNDDIDSASINKTATNDDISKSSSTANNETNMNGNNNNISSASIDKTATNDDISKSSSTSTNEANSNVSSSEGSHEASIRELQLRVAELEKENESLRALNSHLAEQAEATAEKPPKPPSSRSAGEYDDRYTICVSSMSDDYGYDSNRFSNDMSVKFGPVSVASVSTVFLPTDEHLAFGFVNFTSRSSDYKLFESMTSSDNDSECYYLKSQVVVTNLPIGIKESEVISELSKFASLFSINLSENNVKKVLFENSVNPEYLIDFKSNVDDAQIFVEAIQNKNYTQEISYNMSGFVPLAYFYDPCPFKMNENRQKAISKYSSNPRLIAMMESTQFQEFDFNSYLSGLINKTENDTIYRPQIISDINHEKEGNFRIVVDRRFVVSKSFPNYKKFEVVFMNDLEAVMAQTFALNYNIDILQIFHSNFKGDRVAGNDI